MVWYESLQIVSELIPDLSVWFVWSHNPVGHNEDVVSVWGGVCDIPHQIEGKLLMLCKYELLLTL